MFKVPETPLTASLLAMTISLSPQGFVLSRSIDLESQNMDVISLEFHKAFNTVPPNRLFSKLERDGYDR